VDIRTQEYREDVDKLGRDNFETIASCNSLIAAMARSGDPEGALKLGRENLRVTKAKYGSAHAHFQNTANALGGILLELSRYDEAVAILSEIVPATQAIAFEQRKDQHWSVLFNYGFALTRAGDLTEARSILEDVVAGFHSLTGEQSIDAAQAEIKLAECELRLENSGPALELATKAMRTLSALPESHPLRVMSAITALQCAEMDGQPETRHQVYRDFIAPCLAAGGPLADEVRGFLMANPGLVGSENIGEFFSLMMQKPERRPSSE
jgi:tetratricopeptide (TPR) repeat protein